jgi:3-methyladenine DNA glycosylase AlkC
MDSGRFVPACSQIDLSWNLMDSRKIMHTFDSNAEALDYLKGIMTDSSVYVRKQVEFFSKKTFYEELLGGPE